MMRSTDKLTDQVRLIDSFIKHNRHYSPICASLALEKEFRPLLTLTEWSLWKVSNQINTTS